MSSSRWDALKPDTPSSNNRNNRTQRNTRDGRRSTTHNNRDDRGQQSRNRGSWRSSHEKTANSTGENRQSYHHDSWRKPTSHFSKADEKSTLTGREDAWDKMTRKLWECGKQQEESDPQKKDEASCEEMLAILKELGNLLETKRSSIRQVQQVDALAAALHTLAYVQNTSIMGEILDFGGAIFAVFSNDNDKLTRQPHMRMTPRQAQQCITGLYSVHSYIMPVDKTDTTTTSSNYLGCCTKLLIFFATVLPAEETAHQIVNRILLPALEHSLDKTAAIELSSSSTTTSNHDDVISFQKQGIQALECLLKAKTHSSALLAPLVKDVSAEGNEVFLVNPIRNRIFHILQRFLQLSLQSSSSSSSSSSLVQTTTLTDMTYQCLTTALQMAHTVDKSSTRPTSSASKQLGSLKESDLDLPIMEAFFKEKLNGKPCNVPLSNSRALHKTRMYVLELLLAYLKKQPESSLSLGKSLLFRDHRGGRPNIVINSTFDNVTKSSRCPLCINDASNSICSTFLRLLHDTNILAETSSIMTSLAIIIEHVPWDLWLGGKKMLQNARLQGGNISNFSVMVSEAILSIVHTTRCRLVAAHDSVPSRQGTSYMQSLASLVRATLLEIPYEKCNGVSSHKGDIMEAACQLFEALATNTFQDDQHDSSLLERLVQIFEESMGGRITPQGSRTQMIEPASKWLASPSSRYFLDRLFSVITRATTINTEKNVTLAKTSVRLLRSVLKTRPQTTMERQSDWNVFQSFVWGLCESENATLQLFGVQLLHGLLQGRIHTTAAEEASATSKVVDLALSLLPRMIKSPSGPCRSLCFQSYGCLLGTDWFLSPVEGLKMDIKGHVRLILNYCGEMEPLATVRSAACKAVGDICSNCFLSSDPQVEQDTSLAKASALKEPYLRLIGNEISVTILQALKGGNASVRGMAVFALGNLAQVVARAKDNDILDPAILKEACQAAFICMDDANDKVSGNGIRSLGHLGTIVLRQDYSDSMNRTGWNVDEFANRSVLSLSDKVEVALKTLPGEDRPGMSWKQRSTAKKHGRVACNTLALFLKHWRFSESSAADRLTTCRKAILSIVNCIECLGSTLDEKIIIAAMQALAALPSSSLAVVSGKSGLVGNALVQCILFIAKKRWNKSPSTPPGKVLPQVELLCELLLDSASIVDATIVISCEEIAESWMEDLYEWMVNKNCSARAFDSFALAFQKPGLNLSVSVERKFANRALNLLRHEGFADDSDDEL